MAKKWNKYKGEQPPSYTPTGFDEYMGLGRQLRFDDDINKLAFVLALVGGVGSVVYKGLFQGLGSGDAAMSGLGAFMAFVFSYFIAQELTPDRKWGGIIGGVLTVLGALYFGDGNIAVMMWLLFVLRMLNRSSGDRHRIVDNVIIIGIAMIMGKEGAWLMPLFTAALYVVESQIEEGYFRSLYLAGISCVGMIFADRSGATNALTSDYLILMAIAFFLFLPELRLAKTVQAKGDKNGKKLSGQRLFVTQAMFLMVVFGLVLFQGSAMGRSMLPSIMAAIGCGIYLLIYIINNKPKR